MTNLSLDPKTMPPHPSLRPIDEDCQGVQGSVFRGELCTENGSKLKVFAKVSKYVDFVLELELAAWKRLSELASPHFCRVLGLYPVKRGSLQHCILYEAVRNHPESGKRLRGASALHEKLANSAQAGRVEALSSLLQDSTRHPGAVLGCVRQALAAAVLFESVGITHYDLHTDNIMVASTKYDVHVYEFGDLTVPVFTFGITPVVIDFGIAHVDRLGWAATGAFIKRGHTTFAPDPNADLRLLLSAVAPDLTEHASWAPHRREVAAIKRLRRNIKIVLAGLDVDAHGWFARAHFPKAIAELVRQIPRVASGVFKRSNLLWILELLQYSIQLPLQKKEQTTPFKVALLSLAVLWTETVAPIIRNTLEEEHFFKDVVLCLVSAQTDNDTAIPMANLTRLKHRYPKIGNIARIVSATHSLSVAMNNEIFRLSLTTEAKKQELYAGLVTKNALDAFRAFPIVPYRFEAGMTILVQTNFTGRAPWSFSLTKDDARALNATAQPSAIKAVVDLRRPSAIKPTRPLET